MTTHPFEIPFPPRLPDDPIVRGWMLQTKYALDARFKMGSGSPEGVVTADIGCQYVNTEGGAATTLYVKTSGSGNTGWTAK